MTDQNRDNAEAAEAAEPRDAAEAAQADDAAAAREASACAGAPEDAAPDQAGPEDLGPRIAELEAERDAYRSKLQYALADLENLRKRAERERREAEAYGGTRLARDLLTVHDNLERAMAAADDTLREAHAAFFEGVELTHRELLNAFSKHKIEKVAPEKGEAFDPNFHQAMFEAPVPGAESGTVIEMMQAGFTISGRLLRPAMVGVAKAAPAEGGEGA